jgi:hypothetical protein
MPIVGVGNPAPGAGKSLQYMGGRYWAGWSGRVTATSGANGSLFNFRSPDIPLDTTLCIIMDKTSLSANVEFGWSMEMDGIEIADFKTLRNEDMGALDIDPIYFVIPGGSLIGIECYTSDTDPIAFTALLRAVQIGD